MFKNGWVDLEYVVKHVVGLEELKVTVEQYDPQIVEKITGVSVEQLEETARVLGPRGVSYPQPCRAFPSQTKLRPVHVRSTTS